MIEGNVYVFEQVLANPPNGPSYVAYVVLDGSFLGIRFEGATEVEARDKATTFFEETREKREQTRANIEAGRLKREEARIRKSQNP